MIIDDLKLIIGYTIYFNLALGLSALSLWTTDHNHVLASSACSPEAAANKRLELDVFRVPAGRCDVTGDLAEREREDQPLVVFAASDCPSERRPANRARWEFLLANFIPPSPHELR